MDLDDYYEIRGLNVNPSAVFQLPSLPAVDLNVRVGHSGTRVGGVLLTALGSIPLIVGLVFTPIGAALYDHSDGPGFLITGGITLGVGTALVAGDIYMLANSRTHVWTSDGYRLAARSQPCLALSAAGVEHAELVDVRNRDGVVGLATFPTVTDTVLSTAGARPECIPSTQATTAPKGRN